MVMVYQCLPQQFQEIHYQPWQTMANPQAFFRKSRPPKEITGHSLIPASCAKEPWKDFSHRVDAPGGCTRVDVSIGSRSRSDSPEDCNIEPQLRSYGDSHDFVRCFFPALSVPYQAQRSTRISTTQGGCVSKVYKTRCA